METAQCRSCECKAFNPQFWKDSKCKDCFHNILDHAKEHQRHSVEKEGASQGVASEYASEVQLKEKRDYIVKEILTTERAYVENLASMIGVFMRALKAIPDNIISPTQIAPIFSNAEEILPVNNQLLRELEDRWDSWSSMQVIGDIFLKMIPFMKTYTNYTAGYSLGLAALRECEKNSVFQGVVTRCSTEYKLGLESLMIQPVQRIPRYNLLLADLLKNTDSSHPDYPNLKTAAEKMLHIANSIKIYIDSPHINEAIRISENRKKVLDIQNSFLPPNTVSLVAPHRMYVRQGVLTKICRKSNKRFTFFLFSDVLLYADQLPADRFLFHRKLELDTCRFENNGPPNAPFSFVIANTQKSFAVFADSQEIKEEWLADLNLQTKQLLFRRDSFRHKQPFDTSYDDLNASAEAPVWAPDGSAPACMLCKDEFSFFNRRHHCRSCGQIVCGKCSDILM